MYYMQDAFLPLGYSSHKVTTFAIVKRQTVGGTLSGSTLDWLRK